MVCEGDDSSMYELIFNPGTIKEEHIAFAVSEADLENALDEGTAEAGDAFEKQMSDAACHRVMHLNVCTEADRICEQPWVLVQRGSIIACNGQAIDITESDLA